MRRWFSATARQLHKRYNMNDSGWHKNEIRWLRRWLKGQIAFGAMVLMFVVLVRAQSPQFGDSVSDLEVQGSIEAGSDRVKIGEAISKELPPETELIYLHRSPANPVAPTGWRRTQHGWEDVSTWPTKAPSLPEIVMRQELQESAWIRDSLQTLRRVPPLVFAMLQLAAVAVIIGRAQQARQPFQTKHPPAL